MFSSNNNNKAKAKGTIDSLIGASTTINGDIRFKGGLRIDGTVKGNVISMDDDGSMLVISEHARVEGEVRGVHQLINGEVVGPVISSALLELQPQARITGDVTYRALEMHGGAIVSGKLTHEMADASVLKLASPATAAADKNDKQKA